MIKNKVALGALALSLCSTAYGSEKIAEPNKLDVKQVHEMWDPETKKLSPEMILALHMVNLVSPNDSKEADVVLQKVFQKNPDFYRDGGIVEGWKLSYTEAMNFLNSEYSKLKTIEPPIEPTHPLFNSEKPDLVVFGGNLTTLEKIMSYIGYSETRGYVFKKIHFLFMAGDEGNLKDVLEKRSFSKGEGSFYEKYTVHHNSEKGGGHETNLAKVQSDESLSKYYFTVSLPIAFERQAKLAQDILSKKSQYMGGFTIPTKNWLKEMDSYGYSKSFETIYETHKKEGNLGGFFKKYLGVVNEEKMKGIGAEEVIKQAATIAWARSHVQLNQVRKVHQNYMDENSKK